jgi:hypothetical protein
MADDAVGSRGVEVAGLGIAERSGISHHPARIDVVNDGFGGGPYY